MDYLRRILPAEPAIEGVGFYCAATLHKGGGFSHRFCTTISELHNVLTALDAKGETMYVGQALYKTNANRQQTNVKSLKSFFFDIDCGEGKPFPTQLDGIKALRTFVAAAGLPAPVVESSGRGLYARWILDEALEPERWKVVGQKLKALAAHHKFAIDPVRTADTSSVLRPMGSHNRKDPANPKLARVVIDAPDVSFLELVEAVTAALDQARISTVGLTAPAAFAGLNDQFASGIGDDLLPSDPIQVSQRCNAVRQFIAVRGNVPEPVWYNMIGLLRHCTGGEESLQVWSGGHPDYSPAATEEKIQHHKDSGVGPTTCQKIGADNPAGCIACTWSGKIKSPITLGYPDPEPVAMPEEEKQLLPNGYIRTEAGLALKAGDATQYFYRYDLYVVTCTKDTVLGKEVATIRHQMPGTGEYREFNLHTELLLDTKGLLQALINNHVHIEPGDSRNLMVGYLNKYMMELRAKKRVEDLRTQMGWVKDGAELVFVIGDEVLRKDEAAVKVGLSRTAPSVMEAFECCGSVDTWAEASRYLALPGMEPLAFSFLAGAFGSPLMWFTGHSGAMVSMVGESGLGKTMTGKWVLSAYGDPEKLQLQKDDTAASMIARLGTYGSLPAYIDEISNMPAEPLSELVYRITQGRDRNRLTQRGDERQGRTSWKTLALCSSNHPLTDRLAGLKTDASAEINRILEIHVSTPADFTAAHCREIFGVIQSNYGVSGRLYLQYLVDHQDEHRAKLDTLIQTLEKKVDARTEERFWLATAAITIYGALIAKKLGISEIEVTPVMEWVLRLIKNQRTTKLDLVSNEVDIIGAFLDRHAAGGLVTGRDAAHGMVSIMKEPRGPLVYRIMHDQNILMISKSALRADLNERYASYSGLKAKLEGMGALIHTDRRRVLGTRTYFAGAAVPVWEIDLTVPELGRQVARLVKDDDMSLRRVK